MNEDDEDQGFLRVAITDDHVVLFLPDEKHIKQAVETGRISGTVRKPERKQNQMGGDRTLLEQFGAAEADKIGGVLACFEPDPAFVLIRDDRPAPAAAMPKKAKPRK